MPSAESHDSPPSTVAYGAAKAGLLNATQTLAVELAPRKITVNCVAPGGTVTQRFLAPVERFFVGALGLDDLNLTVDFGGRLGYTMRRVISTRSNLAATFSQILSYPTRTQLGFDMRPDATTTASFT